MATYRPTFREALPLYIMLGTVCVVLLLIGLRMRGAWPLVPSSAAVGAIIAGTRLRVRVTVSDSSLESCGLVRTAKVAWSDVERVVSARNFGSWEASFSGPSTLFFVTKETRLSINFKLFSRACHEDVMAHLRHTGAMKASTDAEPVVEADALP